MEVSSVGTSVTGNLTVESIFVKRNATHKSWRSHVALVLQTLSHIVHAARLPSVRYQLLQGSHVRILFPTVRKDARRYYRAAIRVNRSATLTNVGLVLLPLISVVVAAVLSLLQYATKGSRSRRNV